MPRFSAFGRRGGKAWRGDVQSDHKFVEKLRYIHRDPVMRGLVARPEDLARVERTLLSAAFDSCREKTEWVEIESQWTARQREQAGNLSNSKEVSSRLAGPPKQSLDVAPS
jgi:hypothetical protein